MVLIFSSLCEKNDTINDTTANVPKTSSNQSSGSNARFNG